MGWRWDAGMALGCWDAGMLGWRWDAGMLGWRWDVGMALGCWDGAGMLGWVSYSGVGVGAPGLELGASEVDSLPAGNAQDGPK